MLGGTEQLVRPLLYPNRTPNIQNVMTQNIITYSRSPMKVHILALP